MKNLLLCLIALLIFNISSLAQAPEKFKYQAIITDNKDLPVRNKTIGLEISILQSNLNGTIVYQETFTTITSSAGLVNLEIGTGTITSGVFSDINWGVGPYYLGIAVDMNGSGNYISMGASQLLSVPYALYAKQAQSVDGDNDTDPTNEIELPAEDGTEGQILTTDGEGNVSWQTSDLSTILTEGNDAGAKQIKNLAEPSDEQDAVTKAYADLLQAQINTLNEQIATLEHPAAYIGQGRDGGIVFWVDPADNTHGMVCAIEDQSDGIQWYNGDYIITGAIGYEIGTGSSNTDAIIAVQGPLETSYAAGLARAYTGGGFTDWFLPSYYELMEMYINRTVINAAAKANGGEYFATEGENYYWSSTEDYHNNAWVYEFDNNEEYLRGGEKNFQYFVRAVRAF